MFFASFLTFPWQRSSTKELVPGRFQDVSRHVRSLWKPWSQLPLQASFARISARMAERPGTGYRPSLGCSSGGQDPERFGQDDYGFHANADAGREMEDEHDGTEPPEDSEPSLGWARHDKQGCAARLGQSVRYDLEEGAASVRKSRLASKTSGKTLRGVRSADLALYRNPAQPVDVETIIPMRPSGPLQWAGTLLKEMAPL